MQSWTALRAFHATSFEGAGQIVAALATSLALWGLVLLGGGLILQARQGKVATSPLGNGTPALLIGGGALTIGFALLLAMLNLKPGSWRPSVWSATYWICLIVGLSLILQLMLRGLSFRDLGFVAVGLLCLLVAFLSRLSRSKRHKLGTGGRSSLS